MYLKFIGWISLLISIFIYVSTYPVKAQNIVGDQNHVSINEELNSDFDQLYLVFAGPYPASPSSAFGHLFLLVEPQNDDSSNPQLWRAINFAADVENHSSISALYNGLLGNLKGSFEELSFYKKIRDYSYAESRDLWLFSIQLDQSEKIRFSEYINKKKDIASQYRFSDKNCATRINEALHYTLDESAPEQLFVLPQNVLGNEVIKPRLSQPQWIENFEGQLSDLFTKYDRENLSKNNIDTLNATEKAQILKTFEWLYNNKSGALDPKKEQFIQKLRYDVSQEKTDFQFQRLEQKEFNIHYPSRIGVSYLNENNLNKLLLDLRLGLHSFGDNSSTYPKYDYIDLFRFRAMISRSRILVDEFWLFHQSSRQPNTEINSSLSWTLGLGGERYIYKGKSLMAIGIFSGLGKSFNVVRDAWTTSLMLSFNPIYLEKERGSIIFNPEFENRFFFSKIFKGSLKISNPVFLHSSKLINPRINVKGIFSLSDNIYLNSSVEWQSNNLRVLLGLNFNFSI